MVVEQKGGTGINVSASTNGSVVFPCLSLGGQEALALSLS